MGVGGSRRDPKHKSIMGTFVQFRGGVKNFLQNTKVLWVLLYIKIDVFGTFLPQFCCKLSILTTFNKLIWGDDYYVEHQNVELLLTSMVYFVADSEFIEF